MTSLSVEALSVIVWITGSFIALALLCLLFHFTKDTDDNSDS